MASKDSIWYFEDVDLYKIFCPHIVKDFDKESSHSFHRFKKNEFIYFEEDKSEQVFLVSSGKVKVGTYLEDGRELTKAVLTKGEIFGEMAIMGEIERKDFAQALEETIICPLTLDIMNDMMLENKNLSLKMRQLIGLRLRKAERMIASLLFKSSKQRIIEFLLDLSNEYGQKVGFETLVKQFFSHKIIAGLTATSRQTVTTVLNDLKRLNIINFDRKRLLIRDIKLLKEELDNE